MAEETLGEAGIWWGDGKSGKTNRGSRREKDSSQINLHEAFSGCRAVHGGRQGSVGFSKQVDWGIEKTRFRGLNSGRFGCAQGRKRHRSGCKSVGPHESRKGKNRQ